MHLQENLIGIVLGIAIMCDGHTELWSNGKIHSFIPLARAECDDSWPFSGASSIPFCYVLFTATLLHQLFFHPLSPHLAIYFLVYISIVLFPNSYIIPFWEFYFLPLSVNAQTNVIYLTLLSLTVTWVVQIACFSWVCLYVDTKRGRCESTGHCNVGIVLIFCQMWLKYSYSAFPAYRPAVRSELSILLLGITEISSQTKTANMCMSWCIHLTELLPRRLANSWMNVCSCQMKRQSRVSERSEARNGCPTLLSYGIWCSSLSSLRYTVCVVKL